MSKEFVNFVRVTQLQWHQSQTARVLGDQSNVQVEHDKSFLNAVPKENTRSTFSKKT